MSLTGAVNAAITEILKGDPLSDEDDHVKTIRAKVATAKEATLAAARKMVTDAIETYEPGQSTMREMNKLHELLSPPKKAGRRTRKSRRKTRTTRRR